LIFDCSQAYPIQEAFEPNFLTYIKLEFAEFQNILLLALYYYFFVTKFNSKNKHENILFFNSTISINFRCFYSILTKRTERRESRERPNKHNTYRMKIRTSNQLFSHPDKARQDEAIYLNWRLMIRAFRRNQCYGAVKFFYGSGSHYKIISGPAPAPSNICIENDISY
jgi:hypothetical protein